MDKTAVHLRPRRSTSTAAWASTRSSLWALDDLVLCLRWLFDPRRDASRCESSEELNGRGVTAFGIFIKFTYVACAFNLAMGTLYLWQPQDFQPMRAEEHPGVHMRTQKWPRTQWKAKMKRAHGMVQGAIWGRQRVPLACTACCRDNSAGGGGGGRQIPWPCYTASYL